MEMRWTILLCCCGTLAAEDTLQSALAEARSAAPGLTARVIPSPHPREILLMGAVSMECTLSEYSSHVRQIREIKQGPEVLGVGEVSLPVKAADWSAVPWTDGELARLRSCQIGDCAFQLPQRAIDRISREVDWNSPTHLAKIKQILANELEEITRSYQRQGLSGSPIYRDKSDPMEMAAQSRQLLTASSMLLKEVPELSHYLEQYPKATLAGSQESYNWSMEQIGSKPVASITHTVFYPKACGAGHCLWIASRQIFANHYFDGGLSITRVSDTPQRPGHIWVEYVNRSRTSLVEGTFSGLRKLLIGAGARRAAASYLERTARQMKRTGGSAKRLATDSVN